MLRCIVVIGVIIIFEHRMFANVRAESEQFSIQWQSTNQIFRSSHPHASNHLFVRIGDRLRIECPLDASEVSTLHWVDEASASRCALPNDDDRTVFGDCTQPNGTLSLTFRGYTPLPGGFEFKPNTDYYLISTSTGAIEGLKNRIGGLCRTKNMRVRLSVLAKSTSVEQKPDETNDHDESNVIDDGDHRLPPSRRIDISPTSAIVARPFRLPDWRFVESTLVDDGNGGFLSANTIELQSIRARDSDDDDDAAVVYRQNFNADRRYQQRKFDDDQRDEGDEEVQLMDGRDYSIGYELAPYDSYASSRSPINRLTMLLVLLSFAAVRLLM